MVKILIMTIQVNFVPRPTIVFLRARTLFLQLGCFGLDVLMYYVAHSYHYKRLVSLNLLVWSRKQLILVIKKKPTTTTILLLYFLLPYPCHILYLNTTKGFMFQEYKKLGLNFTGLLQLNHRKYLHS